MQSRLEPSNRCSSERTRMAIWSKERSCSVSYDMCRYGLYFLGCIKNVQISVTLLQAILIATGLNFSKYIFAAFSIDKTRFSFSKIKVPSKKRSTNGRYLKQHYRIAFYKILNNAVFSRRKI